MGYRWAKPESKNYAATLNGEGLPDGIDLVQDSILREVVKCAHGGACEQMCSTAFRVTPYELEYYKKFRIPLPALCPNCRHFERLAKRTPLQLWKRACQCTGKNSDNGIYGNTGAHAHGEGHCPNEFETSYAPARKEIVYCEACYNAEVA